MRDPRLDALNLEKIPHVRFVIAVSDHPGHGREQAARLPGLRNAGQAHGAGRATHGGSPYPPSTMLDEEASGLRTYRLRLDGRPERARNCRLRGEVLGLQEEKQDLERRNAHLERELEQTRAKLPRGMSTS